MQWSSQRLVLVLWVVVIHVHPGKAVLTEQYSRGWVAAGRKVLGNSERVSPSWRRQVGASGFFTWVLSGECQRPETILVFIGHPKASECVRGKNLGMWSSLSSPQSPESVFETEEWRSEKSQKSGNVLPKSAYFPWLRKQARTFLH